MRRNIPETAITSPSVLARLRLALIILAVMLGVVYAWNGRHTMGVDGIAYLDIADAYRHLNWADAINAYYSPLYSWLLALWFSISHPSIYSEAGSVHVLNFAVYLWTLFAFDQFLQQLLRDMDKANQQLDRAVAPKWCWLVFGYSVFLWSALVLIGIAPVTPDLCVSGFAYMGAAVLMRARRDAAELRTYVLLGAVLGAGYLTKSPMFAFSLCLITISGLGQLRKIMAAVALTTFLLVAGPFVATISHLKGRLTIGDAARWNYAYFIDGYPGFDMDGTPSVVHWRGLPPGTGTPAHPTRRLGDSPAVYEFSSPVGGSYPPAFDHSYWYEGLSPRFNLKAQLRVLATSFRDYFHILFFEMAAISTVFVLLLMLSLSNGSLSGQILGWWTVWMPPLFMLAMYGTVHVEPRYLGAFLVMFWLGLFAGLRLPKRPEFAAILTASFLTMTFITGLKLGVATTRASLPSDSTNGVSAPVQWRIADGLIQEGIRSGDHVAMIGLSFGSYWARLAGLKIVAEVPDTETYWFLDEAGRARVHDVVASTGASVLVATNIPRHLADPSWIQLDNTSYYFRRLGKQLPRAH